MDVLTDSVKQEVRLELDRIVDWSKDITLYLNGQGLPGIFWVESDVVIGDEYPFLNVWMYYDHPNEGYNELGKLRHSSYEDMETLIKSIDLNSLPWGDALIEENEISELY